MALNSLYCPHVPLSTHSSPAHFPSRIQLAVKSRRPIWRMCADYYTLQLEMGQQF